MLLYSGKSIYIYFTLESNIIFQFKVLECVYRRNVLRFSFFNSLLTDTFQTDTSL